MVNREALARQSPRIGTWWVHASVQLKAFFYLRGIVT